MPQNQESTVDTSAVESWLLREPVLVESVRSGKVPVPADLDLLAKRIWEEVHGENAVAWASLPRNSEAYRQTMRIVRAALGCSPPSVEQGVPVATAPSL